MSDGVGLSVGATNLAAVVVGRTALRRSAVLTRFAHRPPEVGVPSENPNLNERGLILSDFVDRVGDPVGIVAADGTTHRADAVLADALLSMTYTVGGGHPPAGPVAVTYPAHWRPAAVDALRNALSDKAEFAGPPPAPLVSDATAALTALQDDPGVPTRGIVALCDFGGTGTSITLVDAAKGYTPVGGTVRHTDFSGDLVDQALLTRVINDLSAAGTVDLSSTSAIGSLTQLRAQCRGAKERLSTSGVTSLLAELPGHRSEVRLTRNELDEAIRAPLDEFAAVVQDTLERNGIRGADLAAVASVGGGARIPIITTTLSERLRVPVITSGAPELTAAIGAGLAAVRGTVEDGMTSMAAAAPAAAAAGAATAMAPEVAPEDMSPQSSTFGALAWSDANDVPEVTPTDHYDYDPVGQTDGVADVRPQMEFHREPYEEAEEPVPWYRNRTVAMAAGLAVVLVGVAVAVLWVMSDGDGSTPDPAATTGPVTTTTTTVPPPTSSAPPPAAPPATQAPAPRTANQAPPQRTVNQPPPSVTQTVTEPPPAPSPEPPPPSPEPPPPSPEPSTQPPVVPTLPYETIPGLPFVPNPIQPPQPAP